MGTFHKLNYKLFLTNQESRVINEGGTTKYFQLQRGANQDDANLEYLFILAQEIFLIK